MENDLYYRKQNLQKLVLHPGNLLPQEEVDTTAIPYT